MENITTFRNRPPVRNLSSVMNYVKSVKKIRLNEHLEDVHAKRSPRDASPEDSDYFRC